MDPAGKQRVGRKDPSLINQLHLVREGPGTAVDTGPLLHSEATKAVSRGQLRVSVAGTDVTIANQGRERPMLINGYETAKAQLADGDVVEILDQYVFYYTLRPPRIPACVAWPHKPHTLGEPDAYGMVGDGPFMWAFRELLARVALSDEDVLLLGPTGVGKELAARGIWRMSRPSGLFVPCNAPTLTRGLIDSELFGHRANITDGKMPAGRGLLDEAEGGVFFLDEIGDMDRDLQHHLLRAMEGHVRAVGATRERASDVRWIGATNSPSSSLEGDVFGRLQLRVNVPSLDARREDIPALVRRRVLDKWNTNPKLVARFVRIVPGKRDEIAIEPEFITALLRHHYERNVRELESLLEHSFVESEGNTLQPPKELKGEIPVPAKADTSRAKAQAALDEHKDMNAAAAALGISRYALGRRLGRY